MATAASPTRRLMRPPCQTRISWSRPSSSVPNRCSAEGGLRRARRLRSRLASYGASTGASSEMITNAPTMMSPVTPVVCRKNLRSWSPRTLSPNRRPRRPVASLVLTTDSSRVLDARVDQRVGKVDEQVDDGEGDCDEQHAALDDRVVARADGVVDPASDAGPAEDGFGQDRAGE